MPSQPTSTPVNSSLSTVSVPKVTEPKKYQPQIVHIEESTTTEPVKPAEPAKPNGIFAPKEIKGITPIVPKESDLPTLGVTREADGGVAFYMKGNAPKTYYKSIIPATTWGLMHSDNQLPESEISVSTKLTPTLITDTRGNRRMIIYNDEHTSFRMNHSHNATSDSSGNFEDNLTVQYARNLDDSAKRKMIIVKKIEHSSVNHNSDPASTDEVFGNAVKDLKMELKNKIGMNDSLDFGEIEKMIKKYTNSDQLKEAMKVLKDLKINHSDKKLQISIGDDSSTKNGISLHGRVNMSVQLKDEDANQSLNDILINDKPIFQEIDDQLKNLDDLIPVLMRTSTTTTLNPQDKNTYDNGVIFWFAHTPELDQALAGSSIPPSLAVHSPSDNKFLSNTLIYPNPAAEEATVHFSLKGARSLSFTLHDILGKRIADLGMNEYASAGEFTRQLSLGNIAPGIYLLVIASDHGEQQIERIVISR
jgi:hypothetical protein